MTDLLNPSQFPPARTAGRRGARESHEERLLVTKFLQPGALANQYVEWDGTNGVTDWGMDFNGPDPKNPPAFPKGLGDCGWAALDHGNMAKANNPALQGTFGEPVFSPGINAYFAYGVSQGEVGQPPALPNEPDQGVDNASLLGFLYKNGIIDGYGEVPVDQMDAYAPQAHGLLIGQNLPDSAESDFEANPQIPWGSPGEVPDQQEGHDTWYILGHADGSGGLITWGALQLFTVTYRKDFITDAWIIFDKDDPAVDWATLQSALDAVHGVVGAPPAPSGPAVAAAPESFVERIEHDVEEVVEGWWRTGTGDNSKAPIRPESLV